MFKKQGMRLEEHQRHKSDLQAQLSGQGGILRAGDKSSQGRNPILRPFMIFLVIAFPEGVFNWKKRWNHDLQLSAFCRYGDQKISSKWLKIFIINIIRRGYHHPMEHRPRCVWQHPDHWVGSGEGETGNGGHGAKLHHWQCLWLDWICKKMCWERDIFKD